jgi:serine O-acetyltransferase
MNQLLQDLERNRLVDMDESSGRFQTMLTIRMLAAVLFRASGLAGRYSGLLAGLIKQLNQFLTGADIAWRAHIGPGLVLFHPTGVVIGPHVVAGTDLTVQSSVTIGGGAGRDGGRGDSPTFGDRVEVGAGARVLGPVTIGDDAIIGANAVVLSDVPAGSLARGVPATCTSSSRSVAR